MGAIVLACLVLSLGVGAYVQARRAGTWSWRSFLLTVAGLTILGSFFGYAGSLLGRRAGPEHAGGVALGAGAVIIVTVFTLAVLWKRKSRRD